MKNLKKIYERLGPLFHVIQVLTQLHFPVVINKFSTKMILNINDALRYEFINVNIEYVIKGCR